MGRRAATPHPTTSTGTTTGAKATANMDTTATDAESDTGLTTDAIEKAYRLLVSETAGESLLALPQRDDSLGEPLRVGIELEFPQATAETATFRQAGHATHQFYETVDSHTQIGPAPRDWVFGGTIQYDSSCGLELASPPLSATAAAGWYRDTIQFLEDCYGAVHEPTSIRQSSDRYSFGLHLHLSPLSLEHALVLYKLSDNPLMELYLGSALATKQMDNPTRNYTVKRMTGYAKTNTPIGETGSAIRIVDGEAGHIEWRKPEPITPDHFELLMEFLENFHANDPAEGATQLGAHLQSHRDTITAVRRLREIGLDTIYQTPASVHFQPIPTTTPDPTMDFMQAARNRCLNADLDGAPFPHSVLLDDTQYIAFHTMDDTPTDHTFTAAGHEYTAATILDATSLDPITDRDTRRIIADAVTAAWDDGYIYQRSRTTDTLKYLLESRLESALPA